MAKRVVDILPKIAQWQSIPYANDLMCQNCGSTGFGGIGVPHPKIVGWCETNYGFMGVFECPICGERFRFHCGDPIDELDEFDTKLVLVFAEHCINWDEINKNLHE